MDRDTTLAPVVTQLSGLRWRIPLVMLVTVLVNWLDRSSMSIALPSIAKEFGWNTEQIGSNGGTLFAVFFLGYGLANMLLSPIAERFGPKRSLVCAVIAFSICTALNAPFGWTLGILVALRLLLGLGEGIHFPMLSAMTSRWFPPHERSRANGIWTVGILLATVFAPVVIVPIISAFGWRAMFVVLGIVSIVVTLPLVLVFLHDQPPNRDEALRAQSAPLPEAQPPNRGYLRNGTFWVTLLAGTLNNFCAYGILSWLPTYFIEAKGLNFGDLAYAASLPYVAGVIGIVVMAWLGDWLGRRALLAAIGYLGLALAVYLAATAAGLAFTIMFFALAVFCQSAYQAQEFALIQRILPAERVGAGTGFYNGLAVLVGGGLGTAAVGGIVAATGSYTAGLFLIVGVAVCSSLTLFALTRRINY